MESLLEHTAMTFGDEVHDVADLLLVGMLTGDWPAFESDVARGLALEAEHTVDARKLEQELQSFRYERRLIAAAELQQWLATRSLRLADLEGVLRRRLLRGEHGRASPSGREAVRDVLRAEAICTGVLQRCAVQVRTWHAARVAVAELGLAHTSTWPPPPELGAVDEVVSLALADTASGLPTLGAAALRARALRLVSLSAAHAGFRAIAVTDAAIDARVVDHRLDWTIVHGHELSFEHEGPALETRLRVVHDGESLATVAADIARTVVPLQLELGTVPGAVAAELLAARPGELVGPWNSDDGWTVFALDGKVDPGASDDGLVRARARDELLDELVERVAAGKVAFVAAL